MKRIGNFLFVDQVFIDTEETKPAAINLESIDNITTTYNNDKELIIIETDTRAVLVDNDNFFQEFEKIIHDYNLFRAKI